jgi:hypothetical protein
LRWPVICEALFAIVGKHVEHEWVEADEKSEDAVGGGLDFIERARGR